MRFDQSVRAIGKKLDAGHMLVSDATMALMAVLRARPVNFVPADSVREVFYEEAMDALNRELLGYEKTEWDLRTGFRRCNIRTAKVVNDEIHYIPNPLPNAAFHMMWGSRQVEAFLADVIDLSVLESGDQELINREVRLLENKNRLFHSESGVDDIWIVFTGVELLRLYWQLKSAVSGVCEAMFAHENNEVFVAPAQVATNAAVSL